jgi:hypothetical protein
VRPEDIFNLPVFADTDVSLGKQTSQYAARFENTLAVDD